MTWKCTLMWSVEFTAVTLLASAPSAVARAASCRYTARSSVAEGSGVPHVLHRTRMFTLELHLPCFIVDEVTQKVKHRQTSLGMACNRVPPFAAHHDECDQRAPASCAVFLAEHCAVAEGTSWMFPTFPNTCQDSLSRVAVHHGDRRTPDSLVWVFCECPAGRRARVHAGLACPQVFGCDVSFRSRCQLQFH